MPDRKDKREAPPPIYVVHGADEFLKREAIREIVGRALTDNAQHMALSEFEGPTADAATVLDEVRTMPFLAERRLVIVREADAFITKNRPLLEEYLNAPSPCGVLLLVCRSFPATTRLAKAAAKLGQVVRCEPLPSRAIAGWVTQRMQQVHGKQIDRWAVSLLIDLVGENLDRLDSELTKLAIYGADRPTITTGDVEALVGADRQETTWAMLDAIGDRRPDRALQLWERLLATDRDAPYRAIGGVAWGVRQMLGGRGFGRGGRFSPPRFDRIELEDMLVRLMEADLRSKTGLGSVQSQIERFIVELCMAPGATGRPFRR